MKEIIKIFCFYTLFLIILPIKIEAQIQLDLKSPFNSFELSKSIVDSFKKYEIDTFVIYCYGTQGCPRTINPFFSTYWVKNKVSHILLITEKNNFKKDKSIIKKIDKKIIDTFYDYDMSFIIENLYQIKSDSIEVNKDRMFFVNNNIERYIARIKNKEINFEKVIENVNKKVNFKTMAIQDFRSFLFKVNIEKQ